MWKCSSSRNKQLPGSYPQLLGNGEDSLQDGHETRHLAEAAAAHHLGVHRQSLLQAACVHTSGHLVQPSQDLRRERPHVELLIKTFQTLGCLSQLPLCLQVSGRQGAAVEKRLKTGLQGLMLWGQLLPAHIRRWQLLEVLWAEFSWSSRGSMTHARARGLRGKAQNWNSNRCWCHKCLWQLCPPEVAPGGCNISLESLGTWQRSQGARCWEGARAGSTRPSRRTHHRESARTGWWLQAWRAERQQGWSLSPKQAGGARLYVWGCQGWWGGRKRPRSREPHRVRSLSPVS